MKSDKLLENMQKALQGKLVEDNESKLSVNTIMNWFKQCNLNPEYNKSTRNINSEYLNIIIQVIDMYNDGNYNIYCSSFIYISEELDKLITDKDEQLYSSKRLGDKYYNLKNDIANDFYHKYPELNDDHVYNKPVTNENGLQLIKQCKNLIDITVDIVNKNLSTFVKDVLNKLSNKQSKGNLKYKIEYYLNSATADRRETTKSDVEEDYCKETEYFDTDLDAFEYIMNDILDIDTEQWYENETTDDEKIKSIINYFKNQDYGDGSPIICKVTGKKYKYDSGLDIDYFLDEAVDDEDYDDEEEY